jgi:hypothetical protein
MYSSRSPAATDASVRVPYPKPGCQESMGIEPLARTPSAQATSNCLPLPGGLSL